jgi:hypothetical protein
MKLNIRVITKANNTKPLDNACPWILDVPPTQSGK